MILNKYLAALLSIAIVLITAFVAIPDDQRTPATLWQLGILAAGAIATYLVPIVDGRWAGLLKTGAAIVAAVIGALIPLLGSGHLTVTQILVLILAGLNVLAVEVGVNVRKDDVRLAA
ncbi:hypothetical protein GCM10022239_03250 [Leifsonia bigeumensis]|uniref:Holin n=1 Tax=Leifsonella bigeumensis TaxID=433643 RepID=A0ABP7F5D9_9MICO